LISDEIYALSTFESHDHVEVTSFESVLSLDLEVVGCDPGRVHVLWSVSKDFGCSGLRMVSIAYQKAQEKWRCVLLTAVG
jgi:gliotoxin/aspirochlorine biosynthesis aminotransferase